VTTQGKECLHLKACGMYLWMLQSNGGVYTGVTGRRQANHMHFESWFYCFIVARRVNMEQRVRKVGRVLQHHPQHHRMFLTSSAEWAVAVSCSMIAFYRHSFLNEVTNTVMFVHEMLCITSYNPLLMVTFTITSDMLSNMYTPFLMLPYFWQKKSCCDLWSDLCIS
jgi:hypothetical protein